MLWAINKVWFCQVYLEEQKIKNEFLLTTFTMFFVHFELWQPLVHFHLIKSSLNIFQNVTFSVKKINVLLCILVLLSTTT